MNSTIALKDYIATLVSYLDVVSHLDITEIEFGTKAPKQVILSHLRELYRLQKSAFETETINIILQLKEDDTTYGQILPRNCEPETGYFLIRGNFQESITIQDNGLSLESRNGSKVYYSQDLVPPLVKHHTQAVSKLKQELQSIEQNPDYAREVLEKIWAENEPLDPSDQ